MSVAAPFAGAISFGRSIPAGLVVAMPLLCSLSLAPATSARAQPDAASCTAAPENASLFELSAPLLLNGTYLGDVSVRIDPEGRGELYTERVEQLLAPRLADEAAETLRQKLGTEQQVSMSALCDGTPAVAFRSDLLEVHVRVELDQLLRQNLPIGGRPQPSPDAFDGPDAFAAGLGLRARGSHELAGDRVGEDRSQARATGFIGLGGFDGWTLFYSVDFASSAAPRWRRGEARLARDFYDNAVRLQIGELAPLQRGFQRAPLITGLSLSRRYDAIQPFRNIRSGGARTIVLERPAEVEVIVNGAPVELLRLEPGSYRLTDFPLLNGANDVQLILRDELGEEEILTYDAFSLGELLGPGVLDFGVAAGAERTASSEGFDASSNPVLSGYTRYGVTERLSAGINLQASSERQQIGAEATFGTAAGTVDAFAAASRIDSGDEDLPDGASGGAFSLEWNNTLSYLGARRLDLTASTTHSSRDFSGIVGGAPSNERELTRLTLRSRVLPTLNVGLSWNRMIGHGTDGDGESLGATFGTAWGNLGIGVAVQHTRRGEARETVGSLTVAYRLSSRALLRGRASGDERRALSYGWRNGKELGGVRAGAAFSTSDTLSSARLEAEFEHNRFGAEFELENESPDDASRLSTAESDRTVLGWAGESFLGFADGRLALGRRYASSFAVVGTHPTLGDSPVEIRPAGGRRALARSGLLGPALFPISRAYLPQRLSFEVADVPLGYDLGTDLVDILPAPGTGFSYTVGSDASRTVLGILQLPGGTPVALKIGSLTRIDGGDDAPRDIFTNGSGRFAADKIAAGRYRILFSDVGTAEFEVGEDTQGVIDVGTVTAIPAP